MIYFDQAATSFQKPPSVHHAVRRAMEECASIGRSGHIPAQKAADTAFAARELAAELFDTEPERVVFTFNATHGLNIAIRSLVKPGDRVVISGFEHNAVLRPLYHLGAEVVPAGRRLFDQADTLKDFDRAITPDTKAVICTHVSNVFGYVLPLEKIASLCRDRGVPLIVDGSQSAGVLPVSLGKLGAAFIAMPGHKGLYGPQGTGLLLCGRMPEPLLFGGTGSMSQTETMPLYLPDLAEVGTHNVPGIAGLLAGMGFVKKQGLPSILSHERELKNALAMTLGKMDAITVCSGEAQTGVLSFSVDAMDCEAVARRLSDRGIAVRGGLHCAPLAHRSAGTLEAGTVRASFSCFNRREEILQFADVLQQIIRA